MALSRLRRRAITALPLIWVACSEMSFEPVEARLIEPPPIYREWWAEVETCTGMRGSFERVSWYQAEAVIDRGEGTLHAGAWVAPHKIFIRTGLLGNRPVVTHEMIHDLLQTLSHESDAFGRCDGVQ